jgi:NTP pyrophosphatase (non-canonical NTP hydrolase)
MNRVEELLLILSEECAEVAQAAIKCIRFGIDDEYQGIVNRYKLERELGDFLAMFKLLVEEAGIREDTVMEAAEGKLIKVEQFMSNRKSGIPPIAPLGKLASHSGYKPRKNKPRS